MKLVIVADIHGNYDAWRALPEDYDEMWVLGDLVNYGPQPQEVVEAVMNTASLVVQGNHDHAVAHDDDSHWSARYRAMAETTRRHTSSMLGEAHKAHLRGLPVQAQAEREGRRFHLVHAMPSNPFYGRCPPDGDQWTSEIDGLAADIVLVGHSHAPFIRQVGDKVLVNPGSLGQPRTGKPLANYAIWQDGTFTLKSFPYPVETTVAKLEALGFPDDVEAELVNILTTGSV
ncbi:MAG TPA: YfcE family phosphodiesterase [Magnetospirillum sp.]|nr:YfcE family phosphodiesterase [Magnetospirillum sp.]